MLLRTPSGLRYTFLSPSSPSPSCSGMTAAKCSQLPFSLGRRELPHPRLLETQIQRLGRLKHNRPASLSQSGTMLKGHPDIYVPHGTRCGLCCPCLPVQILPPSLPSQKLLFPSAHPEGKSLSPCLFPENPTADMIIYIRKCI